MSKVAERLAGNLKYDAKIERVVFVECSGEDYRALSNLMYNLDVDEDTAYEEVRDALEAIAEMGLESIEENIWEYTESDIYTHDLLEWIGKNLSNVGWCDRALREYGQPDSTMALIGAGQSMAKEHIWKAVIDLVRELEEEEEEEA